MPIIRFLPHKELCPEGREIEAPIGSCVLDVALEHGINIEHACDKSCACTTCHLIIKKGFNSLEAASDREEDLLDKAWGLEPFSRLGCQTLLGEEDLSVAIPLYSLNHAKEG